MLSDDVRLAADGGGKVIAARRVLRGRAEVMRFIQAGLHRWWPALKREDAMINGKAGWVLLDKGEVQAAVSFSYDQMGLLDGVYIVRNPDKLRLVYDHAELV